MKSKFQIAIIASVIATVFPLVVYAADAEKTAHPIPAALAVSGPEDTSEVIEEVLGTVAWEPICLFRGSALVAIVTDKGSICARADESIGAHIKPGASVRMEYHKVIYSTQKPEGAVPQQVMAEAYVITKVEGEPPRADLTSIPQKPNVWEMWVRVIGPVTPVDKGLCILTVADANGKISSAFVTTSGVDGPLGFRDGDIVRMAVHGGLVERKDADGKPRQFRLWVNIVSHGKLPRDSKLSLPDRKQADSAPSPMGIVPYTPEAEVPKPQVPKRAIKKKEAPASEEDEYEEIPGREVLT